MGFPRQEYWSGLPCPPLGMRYTWLWKFINLNIFFLLSKRLGLPGGSEGKESACDADQGSIPGSGRSPGEGNAVHSSILAWRIPWTEKPGRLQSMGSQRVGHDWVTSLRFSSLLPWKKSYNKPRQHIKKQRHLFANKGPYSQSCGVFSSHWQMWQLDHKEGWVPKNWCFWTVSSKNLLDCKEIKLVNPKGNQPWIFMGRTDAKAEAPILCF